MSPPNFKLATSTSVSVGGGPAGATGSCADAGAATGAALAGGAAPGAPAAEACTAGADWRFAAGVAEDGGLVMPAPDIIAPRPRAEPGAAACADDADGAVGGVIGVLGRPLASTPCTGAGMPATGAAADDLDCAGGFDEPEPADAVPGGALSLGGSGGCRSRRAAEYAPATRRASAITAIISFFMEIAGARQVARGQSGIRRERVSMSAVTASAPVAIRLSRRLDRNLHRWGSVSCVSRFVYQRATEAHEKMAVRATNQGTVSRRNG